MTLRSRLRAVPVLPVLIVLVLLGSVLSLVLALTRPDPRAATELPGASSGPYEPARLAGPGAAAIETMAEALPIVLGYDFRTLDKGLRAATGLMTPAFADDFRASFDSSARRLATQQRSVVEARVEGVGQVRLLDDDTVLGLAYVDQVLVRGRTLKRGVEGRVLGRFRVLVKLVAVGKGWRIANISPL